MKSNKPQDTHPLIQLCVRIYKSFSFLGKLGREMPPDRLGWCGNILATIIHRNIYILGWTEKHKSWKMQKYWADSEPRHSTDFRTIFGTMIG